MEYLDLIHAQASLTAIIHSLKLSIDEIKEKTPIARSILKWLKLQNRQFTINENPF